VSTEAVAAVPAYHLLYAPHEETVRVAAWLDKNGIFAADYRHEIRVERRGTKDVIVYEEPPRGRQSTVTRVVELAAPMPEITVPARPDLHALLAKHYPGIFPLINTGCYACTECTQTDRWTAWPCPKLQHAMDHPPAGTASAA
jgi:hypothetical protein